MVACAFQEVRELRGLAYSVYSFASHYADSGIVGVAVLAGVETLSLPAGGGLAVAAGIAASACYGIASIYANSAKSVEAFANAHGSMWAATLLTIPVALLAPQSWFRASRQ